MQRAKLEYNDFSAGLVTEASALGTAEGVVLSCVNYELQKNGAAKLRPPLRYEDNAPVAVVYDAGPQYQYLWDAPAGQSSKQVVVAQSGANLSVTIRDSGLGQTGTAVSLTSVPHVTSQLESGTAVSVTANGADLAKINVVSTGRFCVILGVTVTTASYNHHEAVLILDYDKYTDTIAVSYDLLQVRDFWGVEDSRVRGARVSDGDLDAAAAYNLFNQGWHNEVDGAYPDRFVINDFYNNSGLLDNVAIVNGAAGTGTVTLNGNEIIDSTFSSTDSPRKLRVRENGIGGYTVTITGTDKSGDPLVEALSMGTADTQFTAGTFATVTSVVISAGSATDLDVGTSYLYPGDYDNWTLGVYALSATSKGFAPKNVVQSPDSAGVAPKGSYIIPFHHRSISLGTGGKFSRAAFIKHYRDVFRADPSGLPADRSGRPYKAAFFGGRLWYITTTEQCPTSSTSGKSPNVEDIVLFSRVVENAEDICSCYSKNDPTSPELNEILDDDGGHVSLPDAGKIYAIVPIGSQLAVIASRGTWLISGDLDAGFKATAYQVIKMSSVGAVAPDSAVEIGGYAAFLAQSSIELIAPGETGSLVQRSVTDGLRGALLELHSTSAHATKDYVTNTARWLFPVSGEYKKELVLDLTKSGWYINEFNVSDEILGYAVVDQARTATFSNGERAPTFAYILKSGTDVSTGYLRYDDDGIVYNWEDLGGEYASFSEIMVGHITFGDTQANKYAVYLDVYSQRTEDSYTVASGDVTVNHESSVKVTAYWEWADTSGSPYKSQQFEAYRYRRPYLAEPADGTYPYDYGQSVIYTKNKLRGHGRSLALKFQPSAGKDSWILGWAIGVGAN